MRISISEAAERLRRGGVVAFPTETVYGLGANALDENAVRRVFELKGRPPTSPLIVHVASAGAARELVAEWPPLAGELARRWWPGPLTLVLPKQPWIPGIVTAGLRTVGVRVPAHPVALEILRQARVPVAAPSANRFTEISPTTAEHVEAAFGDAVDIVDGGPTQVGIESTVVAIEGDRMRLLRPGMVSLGELEQSTAPPGAAHPAPGMHARHYSPRTPLRLVRDAPEGPGAYMWITKPGRALRMVQMPRDPAGYAARLYAVLHELDREGLPWIAVEAPPETPEWMAIRDRLRRAEGMQS